MTGTEKQIEYAENLKTFAIEMIQEIIDAQHIERYENKSRDNKTVAQLEKRDRMIVEMKKTVAVNEEVLVMLNNFTGYAGEMIDCCKMKYWNMAKTQVGYKEYLIMLNNCK